MRRKETVRYEWNPIHLEGADAEITRICKEKSTELYGENLPDPVGERLEKELSTITGNDLASLYLVAYEIAEVCRSKGYTIKADLQMGASFVMYLLGVSKFNPLPTHHRCDRCGRFEVANSHSYGETSFDMEKKPCPICGKAMDCSGENIQFENLLGFGRDRNPMVQVSIAPEIYEDVFRKLATIVGEDRILRGSRISRGEEGETRVEVDLSAIHLLPDRVAVDDVTSTVWVTDSTGNRVRVSREYDRWELDLTFTTINVVPESALSLLHELETETGVPCETIPMQDSRTMEVFLDIDTEGLPVFEQERARKHLNKAKKGMNDGLTFGRLMRLLALSNGIGGWRDAELREERIAAGRLDQLIVYRDEVFEQLLSCGLNGGDAYDFSEMVRKGRFARADVQGVPAGEHLIRLGVDKEYVRDLESIDYLQSKPQILSDMEIIWKLAYYKAHFRDQFVDALA